MLSKYDNTVLHGLGGLSVFYPPSFLEEPEIRYPFVYYALFTHWPNRLGGRFAPDELLYNRVYWFLRFSKLYRVNHDFEEDFECNLPPS